MPRMTIEERTYYWYVFRIYIHYPISLPAHPVFISISIFTSVVIFTVVEMDGTQVLTPIPGISSTPVDVLMAT